MSLFNSQREVDSVEFREYGTWGLWDGLLNSLYGSAGNNGQPTVELEDRTLVIFRYKGFLDSSAELTAYILQFALKDDYQLKKSYRDYRKDGSRLDHTMAEYKSATKGDVETCTQLQNTAATAAKTQASLIGGPSAGVVTSANEVYEGVKNGDRQQAAGGALGVIVGGTYIVRSLRAVEEVATTTIQARRACTKPERCYLKGGRHGLKQHDNDAFAMAVRDQLPHGRWGNKADLDHAAKMADTIDGRQFVDFDMRPGADMDVFLPDGKTRIKANAIRVRNNGNGTFHGYPIDRATAGPIR